MWCAEICKDSRWHSSRKERLCLHYNHLSFVSSSRIGLCAPSMSWASVSNAGWRCLVSQAATRLCAPWGFTPDSNDYSGLSPAPPPFLCAAPCLFGR